LLGARAPEVSCQTTADQYTRKRLWGSPPGGLWRWSHHVHVRVLGHLALAEDLDSLDAVLAEPVDPHAVRGRIDELRHPIPEPLDLLGREEALEDGVLHPDPEILESVGQAGAAAVVRQIVGDDDRRSRPGGLSSQLGGKP
jgi:hypothetical protein